MSETTSIEMEAFTPDEYIGIHKGLKSWNAQELWETVEFYNSLEDLPLDDWPGLPPEVEMCYEDEVIGTRKFNFSNKKDQLTFHLIRNFGYKNFPFHFMRMGKTAQFIKNYQHSLVFDELAEKREDNSLELSPEVWEALAELPYSYENILEDSTQYEFDYSEVAKTAKAAKSNDR